MNRRPTRRADLVVLVPDAHVAIAADILFIAVTPVMWAGPAQRWLAALERLVDSGAETFVPGHGPVCGIAEIERLATTGVGWSLPRAGSSTCSRPTG